MRFHLKEILHVPGASLPFESQLDLSDLDFYGERPFAHPIVIHGTVRNMAGGGVLAGRGGGAPQPGGGGGGGMSGRQGPSGSEGGEKGGPMVLRG